MFDFKKALDYLQEFGYLEKNSIEVTEISSEIQNNNSFTNAIKEFQKMALIQVTGELDESTQAAMERPRCGIVDFDIEHENGESAEYNAVTQWKQAIITYMFENFSPDLDQERQREIFRTAISRWTDVVPLVFREVSEQADINVMFGVRNHGDGEENAFDGPGYTLAHAFYPPPVGKVRAGDIHYDEDENWRDTIAPGGIDFLTVTVHEIGHAIGLDHTSVPNSTMNPFYPTPSVPAQDDRDGIKSLYSEHIWIASLYRDLLQRRFDEEGLDFWVRKRFSEFEPKDISDRFCYSKEYSRTMATDLYFWLLDRQPDEEGLAHWENILSNGMSRQDVIVRFLTSAEYLSRYTVPNAFVESLYQRLLNRNPDEDGFKNWVQRMNEGMSSAEVATGFINSEEFCRSFVKNLYNQYLRREPEEEGWRSWTDILKKGLSHQNIISSFLSSVEYRNAVQNWW